MPNDIIADALRGLGAESYRFGSFLPVRYASEKLGRELTAIERVEVLDGWRKERSAMCGWAS